MNKQPHTCTECPLRALPGRALCEDHQTLANQERRRIEERERLILWVVEQMYDAWQAGESSGKLAERLGVNRSLFQIAGGLSLWNNLEEWK